MQYPLDVDFKLEFSDLRVAASDLHRPECVLALGNGDLIAAHGKGGYTLLRNGLPARHVLANDACPSNYLPNGIALSPDGTVLFANLGETLGGVFSINGNGEVTPLVETVDGKPIPPTNFVSVDNHGVIWFTVSTRLRPRTSAWSHRVADGFIGISDRHGTRIVADNIGYTNEIAFSPDGKWLYVNETYNQRVSRFPLLPGPALGSKEIVCQLSGADFPDGLCFDAFGGAWLTCVGSNRVMVIRPDGAVQTVLEDTDAEHAERLARKILANDLTAADMAIAGNSRLKNVSSLVFGGSNLTTVYLGCLLGDKIMAFDSPIRGAPTSNWERNLQ